VPFLGFQEERKGRRKEIDSKSWGGFQHASGKGRIPEQRESSAGEGGMKEVMGPSKEGIER